MRAFSILFLLISIFSSNAQIKPDKRISATKYNCVEFIIGDYLWATRIKICTKDDKINVDTTSSEKFVESISSRYTRYADDLPAVTGMYAYLFGDGRQVAESAERFFYLNYAHVENIQKIRSGKFKLKDVLPVLYNYWTCEGLFCEADSRAYLPIEAVDYYYKDGDRKKIRSTVIPIYSVNITPTDSLTIIRTGD